MSTQVSEAVARPVRTAVQATPAWIITEFLNVWFIEMTGRQFAATVLFLTLVFSWLQALIENERESGFLRDVPPKNVEV